MVYQLAVPPLIGLADTGDFERLFSYSGLAHISTKYEEKYFLHFNSKYKIIPRSTGRPYYVTSTLPLVRAARWLSIRMGDGQTFDIRVLAGIYGVIHLFGIWLFLFAARAFTAVSRVILSVLLILMFTDVGYVSCFNSFYSEPTALVFLAVGIACSAILIVGKSSGVALLVGYFLAVAMVVTSKPMYAPLALVFGGFGIYLCRYLRHKRRYWLAGGLTILLCGFGAWIYDRTPQAFRVDAVYIQLFMDLLPNSRTPEQDLVDIGLNPEFAAFRGTTPYQSDTL